MPHTRTQTQILLRLTDGFAYVSEAVIAQDRRWQERWRDFLAARAAKKYGCPPTDDSKTKTPDTSTT